MSLDRSLNLRQLFKLLFQARELFYLRNENIQNLVLCSSFFVKCLKPNNLNIFFTLDRQLMKFTKLSFVRVKLFRNNLVTFTRAATLCRILVNVSNAISIFLFE